MQYFPDKGVMCLESKEPIMVLPFLGFLALCFSFAFYEMDR